MKKVLLSLALMLSMSVLATPSFATVHFTAPAHQTQSHGGFLKGLITALIAKLQAACNYEPEKPSDGGSSAVPEIDGAGAALAIALMGGLVSISRERRKAK